MKRILNFSGRIGRYDIPSFLFTENETLEIAFNLQRYTLGKYIAIITCGNNEHVFSLEEDMQVTIPPDFIKRGNYAPISILLELRTMPGDKVIIPSDPAQGGFHIEPLYIEKVNGNVTAIAWCQDLEKRVAHLEAKLGEFEDKGTPLVFEE